MSVKFIAGINPGKPGEPGDRVGTMAWNTERHVEAWFGIMGLGAICHTLNPRLFAEQLDYIINHAGDDIIFVDLTFLPILEAAGDRIRVLLESNVTAIGETDVEIEQRGKRFRVPNDVVIVNAGGILPTAFLRETGIEVETKFGTA